MLGTLAEKLRQSLGILHKQDIQIAAKGLGEAWNEAILLGDDCAAIPDGDGFLLLAAEGMLPQLIATDPWFAGWCAIMVNVSDIYSMGGKPIAVVDTLWSESPDSISELLAGMKAASSAYQVPIVGGHTNCRSSYNALSVAILGRAQKLLTSFNAQPDDLLLVAIDLRGQFHPDYPFWNTATNADPSQLQKNLAILPQLAEAELCDTAKDISMGGIIGTLLMLTETSNCGAVLDLDKIPLPVHTSLERWLISFPSYGFLLSVRPVHVQAVQSLFQSQDLACAVVGTIQTGTKIILKSQNESVVFWDFAQDLLTGFSK
ncbi:sll0787 family AIR synthase-like protein [Pseudanabaena sp. FACHB-1998]|uniref:sll0787 family AIR synthase-like protein n=1 Tax=Pseudanabaena sp. FACHB-1998 TaxID=2692858 RepID=UPI0016819C79|nr:sll0787 family AIR synthase-like protein [Pseudanabaena sp. FACHB-1998]MBD2175352.1 sll0787 family AIR synthase-like protein [Pseudanabaena sp. FACHB-1998]